MSGGAGNALAQVGEKRSYEPDYVKDDIYLVKAKHKASMSSATELSDKVTRHLAGDKTLITQTFGNGRELSPFVEACRVTIQRVEPKNTFTKGHLEMHNKVLREELLLRADAIRKDHTRREQQIQKQIARLKLEKQYFEDNICDFKQKAEIESNKTAQEANKATGKHAQCAQS
jgi:hypothetical protein